MAHEHLKRWSRPEYYVGKNWPEYYSAGVGRSRDSDALERSNFRCMLRALGGESETVLVIRESHWAVGWVEWIAIHESDTRALDIADRIKFTLEDYPVIDDEDFSREETEKADSVWRDCYSVKERIAHIRKHRSEFDFHDYADLLGCVRGEYYAGHAANLLE